MSACASVDEDALFCANLRSGIHLNDPNDDDVEREAPCECSCHHIDDDKDDEL